MSFLIETQREGAPLLYHLPQGWQWTAERDSTGQLHLVAVRDSRLLHGRRSSGEGTWFWSALHWNPQGRMAEGRPDSTDFAPNLRLLFPALLRSPERQGSPGLLLLLVLNAGEAGSALAALLWLNGHWGTPGTLAPIQSGSNGGRPFDAAGTSQGAELVFRRDRSDPGLDHCTLARQGPLLFLLQPPRPVMDGRPAVFRLLPGEDGGLTAGWLYPGEDRLQTARQREGTWLPVENLAVPADTTDFLARPRSQRLDIILRSRSGLHRAGASGFLAEGAFEAVLWLPEDTREAIVTTYARVAAHSLEILVGTRILRLADPVQVELSPGAETPPRSNPPVEGIPGEMRALLRRFERLQARTAVQGDQLRTLEQQGAAMQEKQKGLEERLDRLEQRLVRLEQRLATQDRFLGDLRAALRRLRRKQLSHS